MIIGVTGPIASGTDKVGEILKPEGFQWLSYSDVLREVAAERNFPVDRKGLQDLGDLLRKEEGTGFLSKFLVEKMKKLGGENFVVGNIRNPGEVEVLREEFGDEFVLMMVDASQDVRFDRLLKRAREGDPKTWEDFLKVEERDLGLKEAGHGQKHGDVFDMADFVVGNDRSEEEFKERVLKLVNSLNINN